ncbi:hypothetical protein DICVIV_09134 [Dictyocaulus viviparus]|uniref:F-box domain-containing protein n=1 Tax=Dictyocaulus viviparus TaxID=29172 RepID=A0A0D8XJT7_DICVI|nr:hypothetical protein DICVIV_09134 [Dictyocaulus viviparus]
MSWPGPSDCSEYELCSTPSKNYLMANGQVKKHRTAERIKVFRQWMADVDDDEKKLFIRELLIHNECDLPNLEYINMLISRLRVSRSRPNSNRSKDPLTLLPSHIVLRIMGHLDPGYL